MLELTECSSDDDLYGCMAVTGGELVAHKVHVTGGRASGFVASLGGHVELRECSR